MEGQDTSVPGCLSSTRTQDGPATTNTGGRLPEVSSSKTARSNGLSRGWIVTILTAMAYRMAWSYYNRAVGIVVLEPVLFLCSLMAIPSDLYSLLIGVLVAIKFFTLWDNDDVKWSIASALVSSQIISVIIFWPFAHVVKPLMIADAMRLPDRVWGTIEMLAEYLGRLVAATHICVRKAAMGSIISISDFVIKVISMIVWPFEAFGNGLASFRLAVARLGTKGGVSLERVASSVDSTGSRMKTPSPGHRADTTNVNEHSDSSPDREYSLGPDFNRLTAEIEATRETEQSPAATDKCTAGPSQSKRQQAASQPKRRKLIPEVVLPRSKVARRKVVPLTPDQSDAPARTPAAKSRSPKTQVSPEKTIQTRANRAVVIARGEKPSAYIAFTKSGPELFEKVYGPGDTSDE